MASAPSWALYVIVVVGFLALLIIDSADDHTPLEPDDGPNE